METSKQTSDLSDLLLGGFSSLMVNMLWILIAPADQRIILVALASVVLGVIMLLGEKTGAYGMGILVGAMAAGMIGLALVAGGMSAFPLRSGLSRGRRARSA